jgi:homoserine dehydrogenase
LEVDVATVSLALTGFGSVGQGVAELLMRHGAEYKRRYGTNLVLTGVADRGGAAASPEGLEPETLLRVKHEKGTISAAPGGIAGLQGAGFLRAAAADVLLEAASTNFTDAEPGWGYARDALASGMDVVLASKGALVVHWDQLMGEARDRHRRVLFSGTTGAPLPVLELADRALVGTHVSGFEAIVNATTNQILTSMAGGASYEESVVEAQRAGIAETDPTLDVDGWDAAAKVVIITRAVLGLPLTLAEVEREGIRHIRPSALRDAEQRGRSIKLIARAERRDGIVRARVAPEERPLADPLGRLRGQEMGIVFNTRPLGQVTSSVQHTGGVPTALTILRDVINLARDRAAQHSA